MKITLSCDLGYFTSKKYKINNNNVSLIIPKRKNQQTTTTTTTTTTNIEKTKLKSFS